VSDILHDYRAWAAKLDTRIGTHSPECHLWPRHERCMIHRLAREAERLRDEIRCATLTDAEREAVERAIGWILDTGGDYITPVAATLRGFLARLGGGK